MIKPKVTYTIDEDILQAFKNKCEDKSINMSKWIEKQMYLFIKED